MSIARAMPRGGASRLAPVPECARCKREGGPVPPDQDRPARRDGAPFGLPGPICQSCYRTLYYRRTRGKGGPSNGDRAGGSLAGWQARAAVVRADVLACAAGYEPEDRDPLRGPWRAEPPPDPGAPRAGRSAAACAELLGAWRMGPRALARAAFAAKGG